MGDFVKKLMGGGAGSARKQAVAKNEQQVNLARQQQDAQAASAQTEQQLSRVSRTPRGRRSLIGEAGSKLG